MESKFLNLTLISAKGLKNASLVGEIDVYVVLCISDTFQKHKTSVNKGGGPNPTWNFPIKFTVNAAVVHNQALTVKIKAAGWFVDTEVGQVHVSIKQLMEGLDDEGNPLVSLPVIRKGNPKGEINLSYGFSSEEPVAVASDTH